MSHLCSFLASASARKGRQYHDIAEQAALMAAGSRPPAGRIDGWKSIGAHFGRDRTTAIRWARERALPVHRMPGGKTATVYALRGELEHWAQNGKHKAELAEKPIAASQPRNLRILVIVAALFGLGAVGTGLLVMQRVNSPTPAVITATLPMPEDAAVADSFLKGRDLLADREAASIEKAITLLRDVTRRDPAYGPGYVALAEALVLSREFGTRSDRDAFPEAREAARAALRLSPTLGSAQRVNGFVAYWWDQDFPAARQYFEKAIALAPNDAIGHFWYGNILADHGNSADALRHLGEARAMIPGSVPIQVDLAWALWSAGQRQDALDALHDLARRHPDFAVIHDCLGDIYLADGDYSAYVREQSKVADLRQNLILQTRSAELSKALAKSPESGKKMLLEFAYADLASGESRTGARAAFVASVAQDRDGVIQVIREAKARRERWGDAGLVRVIKQRWAGDKQIETLLVGLARS